MKKELKLSSKVVALSAAITSLCLAAGIYAQEESLTRGQFGSTEAARQGVNKVPASHSAKGHSSLSSKDKTFIKAAAKGGMMEVEMGRMAADQKGSSSEVKMIGRRMVTDHSKANRELMALAANKGIELWRDKPRMEEMGADFDKRYIAMMVKDHQKDIAAFEAEARDGDDVEVKAFASKMLPTLRKHMALVKDAQARMR